MLKKIFYIISFSTFIILLTKFYFSDQHVKRINKFRYTYLEQSSDSKINIPLLKNDTNNTFIYVSDLENFKNKRKKRFWEKLISNSNE